MYEVSPDPSLFIHVYKNESHQLKIRPIPRHAACLDSLIVFVLGLSRMELLTG